MNNTDNTKQRISLAVTKIKILANELSNKKNATTSS